MIIEDLARNRRFASNLMFKEHGIRFYDGISLLAPTGQPVGSLCLLDAKPRQLTEREIRLLQEHATEIMEELARRIPMPQSAPKLIALVDPGQTIGGAITGLIARRQRLVDANGGQLKNGPETPYSLHDRRRSDFPFFRTSDIDYIE